MTIIKNAFYLLAMTARQKAELQRRAKADGRSMAGYVISALRLDERISHMAKLEVKDV